jgi:type I pantothenate kinase
MKSRDRGRPADLTTALHHHFQRSEWSSLSAGEPLLLTQSDLESLCGVNEAVSLDEAAQLFPPLSRLLRLRISAARSLGRAIETCFLGGTAQPSPFVIAIGGSVAVGKSTFARLLRTVISRWPECPNVVLVTTDGFLLSTVVLERSGMMERKGFPESYDLRRMIGFLADLKSNKPELRVPVYSHERYDIEESEFQIVSRPDILIFEGLNVLQPVPHADIVASDFFDFSIYLDADAAHIEEWYVERFLVLQRSAFQNPDAYFHQYRDLAAAEARTVARTIWHRTNHPNLLHHIEHTRSRADLVIRKGRYHALEELWLRRS